MTPEIERFLNLATGPLDKHPEAREEARAELMGRVSHQGIPLEMIDLSAETEVLESAPIRNPWTRRVAMLAGLILCLALLGWGVTQEGLRVFRAMQAQSLSNYYQWGHSFVGVGSNLTPLHEWQARVAPDLPITGNYQRYPSMEDETRMLRERYPDDLAILQEHLYRRSTEHDEFMTEAARQLIERLDPDNALWPWMESRWLRDKAYGRDPTKMRYFLGRTTGGRVDADLQAEGWKMYRSAATHPMFRDYSPGLSRRQVEAFPSDGTFMSELPVVGFRELVFSAAPTTQSYSYRSADEDFGHEVNRLVSAGDKEGMSGLSEAWLKLTRMMAASENAIPRPGVQVLGNQAAEIGMGFARLSMGNKQSTFDKLTKDLAAIPTRSYISSSDPMDDLVPIRGQMGSIIPNRLEADELKPGRMVERAFFDRLVGWFGLVVLLFVTLCCGFEAYRRHICVRGMARGLSPLFDGKDQIWVGMVGLGLPVLYWCVVTRLIPLGFRQFGMDDEWMTLGWLLQTALGLVFFIVMLVQAVQWRWGRRGAFLGFRSRVDWLGWAVAGILGLAIPAVSIVGFISGGGDEEKAIFLLCMSGAGLVGVLWLLWIGGMNLFTFRQGALRPNVVSRTLLPWFIAASWVMLLCIGFLSYSEKMWAQKDTLFPHWTSEVYLNAYEERAVEEIRSSLQTILAEVE